MTLRYSDSHHPLPLGIQQALQTYLEQHLPAGTWGLFPAADYGEWCLCYHRAGSDEGHWVSLPWVNGLTMVPAEEVIARYFAPAVARIVLALDAGDSAAYC